MAPMEADARRLEALKLAEEHHKPTSVGAEPVSKNEIIVTAVAYDGFIENGAELDE